MDLHSSAYVLVLHSCLCAYDNSNALILLAIQNSGHHLRECNSSLFKFELKNVIAVNVDIPKDEYVSKFYLLLLC